MALPAALAGPQQVAPILRGACALPDPAVPGAYKRFVLDFRGGPAVLNLVNGAEIERYGRAGVATPDHTIRTKNYPLIVPAPAAGQARRFRHGGARRGRESSSPNITPISPATTRRRAASSASSIRRRG